MFKYYLAQRFSNSGISRTPKLPQIRPGRDPYLIRLFSRLPHLMRFLSLDVLLQKLYETHYQISHTFCYLWLELQSKHICWDPLTPHQRKRILRLWVSGPYFESLLTYSQVCFWLFKICKCIHTYCICCAPSTHRILYKRK